MSLLVKPLLKFRQTAEGLRRRVRTRYWSLLLRRMGAHCQICDNVRIIRPEQISLGNGVVLNDRVLLQACGAATIEIGNHVNIAYDTMIVTGSRDFSDTAWSEAQQHVASPVVIGDRVVINARAVILPGVTIGDGAVVAANSLVTRNVASGTLVFGVPARVIKKFRGTESTKQ